MTQPSNSVTEERLHQLADGELSGDEAERFEASLSDDDLARLDGIRRVGDLVRLGAYDLASGLDSESLLASVQEGIEKQAQAGFGSAFRVIEGGGESADQDSPAEGIPSFSPDEIKPEGWKIVVPITTGLLAAAVVLLVVLSGDRAKPKTAETRPPIETVIETPAGNEVLNVDLGQNAGTVFAVAGDAGEPLAVIWIEEEGGLGQDDLAGDERDVPTSVEEGSSI